MTELISDDLAHFCGNLQYRLQLLAGTRAHTDRLLATRFNVFEYIRPDENRLSDLLADLLDPRGKHGQGDVFLREFVRMICGVVPSPWKFRAIRREITTSFIVNHQRRLDILIDLETFGIAIENKPWAGEQEQQVHDHVTHLNRRFAGNFMVVYLSADGAKPMSIDVDFREQLIRDGKIVLCAYGGRFHGWLKRCHQLCAAEKLRWFLSDFMAYAEQNFPVMNLSDDE